DTIGETAVDLPFNDHRVDAGAAVVNCDEPPHLHSSGALIHVNDADVGAVGVGQIRRVVYAGRIQMPFDALGQLQWSVRRKRDLLDRLRHRRVTLYRVGAFPEFNIVRRDLHHGRGDDLRLVDDTLRRDGNRSTGYRRGTAAAGPQTGRCVVGVPVYHVDV